MQVELDGFQLRSFRTEDAPSLARSANDPRVAANLRDAFPNPYTLEDAEEWIAIVHGFEQETSFAIADGPTVLGGIGLKLQQDVHAKTAEVGYWLGVDYWGRGIATRALQWMTRHAFEEFGLVRIYATVFEDNPASNRVLEKAGFAFEGRLRQAAFKNGRILDTLMYAILRDELSPSGSGGAGPHGTRGGLRMNEMVLLCRAIDANQAAILVAELEGRSIPTRRVGGGSIGSAGAVPIPEALGVEVWVPAERADAALAVLAESRVSLAGVELELPAWTCAGCGEENEGIFELCWKCQSGRPADSSA